MVENEKASCVQEAELSAEAFDAFARLLLNEPSEPLMRIAACLLPQDLPWEAGGINELRKCYDERFVIASSGMYVPLCESVVRTGRNEKGTWSYGPVFASVAAHVAKCYNAAGFPARSVRGDAPSARNLRPDHLAVEVSFLAFLNRRIVASCDDADRDGWMAFACSFADEHVSKTASKAAEIANEKGDDVYAALLVACSLWITDWAGATRSRLP